MKLRREPNYKGLFFLALFFISFGIVLSNYFDVIKTIGFVFVAVGGLFLIISFKNKDKWIDK